MACYHMNVISYTENRGIRKDGNISDFKNRIIFSNSPEFKGYEYYEKINKRMEKLGEPYKYKFIPCGKCIGCRAEERKNWTLRIELETKKYDNNYFITLTYDDEHLIIPEVMENPKTGEIYVNNGTWKGSLRKKDLSQFLKSFRTYCKREFDHNGVKFYACGELGEKFLRPHYHAILINCPEIPDLLPIGKNKKTGDLYFNSPRIAHIWGKGFITIGKVTWDSISYTAGYCSKKLFGEKGAEYYAKLGTEPIFALMSRNPGIGKEYWNLKGLNIYDYDEIINSKGQSIKPPRYFDKLADKENHEYITAIKEIRSKKAKAETEKKMSKTTLTIAEQLKNEEETALYKQKIYNRERIK